MALITGGASGLGKATAEWLVKLGITVFAIDLPAAVEKAKQERTAAGKPIEFRCADVGKPRLGLSEPRRLSAFLSQSLSCNGVARRLASNQTRNTLT